MYHLDFHMLQNECIACVGCFKNVWFEQVLRALPAETMVDGLPRVSSCFTFSAVLSLVVLECIHALRVLPAVTWLTVYRWLRMVRSTLLQDTRGRQIASGGDPPVRTPDHPLTHDISGSNP